MSRRQVILLIAGLIAGFVVGLLIRTPLDRCLEDPACAAKLSDPSGTVRATPTPTEEPR